MIQGNLLHPWTEFVGRERERASLARLLRRARLVTVVGLSGVGKSRLARQVVEELRSEESRPVWFVPCDEMEDAAAIDPIVREVSGVGAGSSVGGLRLATELADRRALLFLDAADCLPEKSLREYLQLWLERAPEVTVLLTSASPTGLPGEHLFPLRPMYPPRKLAAAEPTDEPLMSLAHGDAAGWLEADAIRLFEARAQQRDCEWHLTPTNLFTVVRLCREMDWLPLGIELMAGQLSPWTEAQLLDHLLERGNRLDLAVTGGPARHSSLRSAIAWSWERFTSTEQALASQLTALGGQLFEEALQPVTGNPRAVECAASLYRKGVLQAEPCAGRLRYRLPETIRQFVREQTPTQPAHQAGASQFALQLAREEGSRLGTAHAAAAMEALRVEAELLSQCWLWARESRDSERLRGFATALWSPLIHGGELPCEAVELTLASLEGATPATEEWYRLSCIAGAVAARHGLSDAALSRLRPCLEPPAPEEVRALAQRETGLLQIQHGQSLAACDLLQQCLASLTQLGRESEAAWARQALALAHERLGDRTAARRLLDESRLLFIELELLPGRAGANVELARLAADEGRWDAAAALAQEALQLYEMLGQRVGCARAQLQLARSHAHRRDTLAAQRLYTEALRWLRAAGSAASLCQALLQVAAEKCTGLSLIEPSKSYREAITIARDCGLRSLLAHALHGLAELYASQGLVERAVALAEEAVDVARETTEPPLIQGCLERLNHLQGSCGRAIGLPEHSAPTARALHIESVSVRTVETPACASTPENPPSLPVQNGKSGAHGRPKAGATEAGKEAPAIRVRLLGGMSLLVGEEEVPLVDWWAKAKKLFAYLVIHRGRPVSRDILLEEFWPGGDQQRAIHSLQTTLSFLRRSLRTLPTGQALADRLIVARDGNYVFDGSARCESDLQLFDEHVDEAARLKASGRMEEAAYHWAEADRLYVGDLLPEFPYEDWCASPRERLRSHYLDLLLSLGTHHRQAQRPREALRTAERMFAIDGCDERAHRMAMRCHVQLGRPVDALRQFERCCQALERELRVQPSKPTRDLHELIRRRMDSEPSRSSAHANPSDGLAPSAP